MVVSWPPTTNDWVFRSFSQGVSYQRNLNLAESPSITFSIRVVYDELCLDFHLSIDPTFNLFSSKMVRKLIVSKNMGCAKTKESICGLFKVGSNTRLRIYVHPWLKQVDIPIANEINSLETSSKGNLNDRLANLIISMGSGLSACSTFTSDIPTALFAPFWITKSPGRRSTNSESML
jgi:hypothetical protein